MILGRGSGSFFGGFLIGTIGARRAFKTMGLVAVIGGIIYGLMHFFWLHKYTDTVEKQATGKSKFKKICVLDRFICYFL